MLTIADAFMAIFEDALLDTAQRRTQKYGVMFAFMYTEGKSAQEENMLRRTGLHYTFTSEVVELRGRTAVYTDEALLSSVTASRAADATSLGDRIGDRIGDRWTLLTVA